MKHQTIITTDQLFSNLNTPNWLILDCRSTELHDSEAYKVYEKGHIPNASYCFINSTFYSDTAVGHHTDFSSSFDLVFEELNRIGFDVDTQMIIYGNTDDALTDQIWLFMRSIGFTDTAVLQGGYKAWKDHDYPISGNQEIQEGKLKSVFVAA